jgi:hypothetical protein
VLVGAGTLIGSGLPGVIVAEPAGASWFVLLAWSAVVTQVVAPVLLIAGGVRLGAGAGRGALITGAALEFGVCAGYVVHAVVAPDADEPTAAAVVFIAVPVVVWPDSRSAAHSVSRSAAFSRSPTRS